MSIINDIVFEEYIRNGRKQFKIFGVDYFEIRLT